jgi:hypothetical protein
LSLRLCGKHHYGNAFMYTCIATAIAGDYVSGFVPWSCCFAWNTRAKHCCWYSILALSLWYYAVNMLLYVLPYHTWCLHLVLLLLLLLLQ